MSLLPGGGKQQTLTATATATATRSLLLLILFFVVLVGCDPTGVCARVRSQIWRAKASLPEKDAFKESFKTGS